MVMEARILLIRGIIMLPNNFLKVMSIVFSGVIFLFQPVYCFAWNRYQKDDDDCRRLSGMYEPGRLKINFAPGITEEETGRILQQYNLNVLRWDDPYPYVMEVLGDDVQRYIDIVNKSGLFYNAAPLVYYSYGADGQSVKGVDKKVLLDRKWGVDRKTVKEYLSGLDGVSVSWRGPDNSDDRGSALRDVIKRDFPENGEAIFNWLMDNGYFDQEVCGTDGCHRTNQQDIKNRLQDVFPADSGRILWYLPQWNGLVKPKFKQVLLGPCNVAVSCSVGKECETVDELKKDSRIQSVSVVINMTIEAD
jgi:hypothetical protein